MYKPLLSLSSLAEVLVPFCFIFSFLELINEYSKVSGYKINTQKSLEFLHINNEQTERGINEIIPFTVATKRIKCIGIDLPKETKDLYMGNYKALMKDIKNYTNEWQNIPCS